MFSPISHLIATDDKFMEYFKDPDVDYANVAPFQMIEHLYAKYGVFTLQDISENRGEKQR